MRKVAQETNNSGIFNKISDVDIDLEDMERGLDEINQLKNEVQTQINSAIKFSLKHADTEIKRKSTIKKEKEKEAVKLKAPSSSSVSVAKSQREVYKESVKKSRHTT